VSRRWTAAEEAMLDLTCRRAGIADGQDVLELGCGWGSLTLWMAERYPGARIVAVSNSTTQRAHILARASERGLANVTVLTADVGRPRDRIARRRRRSGAVRPRHQRRDVRARPEPPRARTTDRTLAAPGRRAVRARVRAPLAALPLRGGRRGDWMARHFFTGGMMPSEDWIPRAIDALEHRQTWRFDGRHYTRTLAAWRERLEAQREATLEVLGGGATEAEAERRWHRWRTFLIACEELFAARRGREWGVVHHRMSRPARRSPPGRAGGILDGPPQLRRATRRRRR
jgi:cyclopropane-fatty-acyl-phospholipid synthase